MSERDRTKFFVDVPATKAAETATGDLKLLGYASTWGKDRDNEWVEPRAFDKSLDKYMQQNPILLWQHDLERPIGQVEAAAIDKYGLNIRAHVPRPDDREPDWMHHAYSKIKKGIVKTFSVGGFFEKQQKGGKRVISNVDLFEVSVVSVPSNPDSIFAAAVKSLAGPSRPELLQEHVSQMKQLLGMEAFSSPDLASMEDDELQERYKEIAGVYRKVGKLPPGFDSYRELEEEVTKGKGTEGAIDRAGRAAAIIRQVQGYIPATDVEMKAGRVLSKVNEERLRNAYAAIKDVLDVIDKMNAGDDDEGGAATGAAGELRRSA